MIKNIAKVIIVIVCLIFFFTVSQAQRGGGSRRRSSGSRGSSGSISSHSWSRSSRKQRNDVDLSTIFGLNPQKQEKLSLAKTVKMWIFRVIFAVIGLSVLYSGYTTNRDNKIFFKVQDILFQFKYRKSREPPTMSKKQCEAFVDSLKSKAFTMTFWQKCKEKSWSCKMDVSLIIKLSQVVYEINFKGTDDFGSFKMEGPLVLTKQGIEVMLLKKYGNAVARRQTGTFQYLFYEGCGSIGQCQGKWGYFGHQKEDKYNGTWIMTSQDS